MRKGSNKMPYTVTVMLLKTDIEVHFSQWNVVFCVSRIFCFFDIILLDGALLGIVEAQCTSICMLWIL